MKPESRLSGYGCRWSAFLEWLYQLDLIFNFTGANVQPDVSHSHMFACCYCSTKECIFNTTNLMITSHEKRRYSQFNFT